MSFKDLKAVPESIKLDSRRFGVLSCLETLKDGIDSLPTEKPSWRSFSSLETNIEAETANLHSINKKIAGWFKSKGGENDDLDFVDYRKKASVVLSTIEKARNDYFDLLSSADLVPKPEVSGDLLGILKSLTATQKAAVEAQTSSNKSHKRKEMDQTKYDPIMTLNGFGCHLISIWG